MARVMPCDMNRLYARQVKPDRIALEELSWTVKKGCSYYLHFLERRRAAFRRPIHSEPSRYLQSGQTGPFVVKLKSRFVALLPL
jgi:hypothetical protein